MIHVEIGKLSYKRHHSLIFLKINEQIRSHGNCDKQLYTYRLLQLTTSHEK